MKTIWAMLIIVQTINSSGNEPATTTVGPYNTEATCLLAAKKVEGISFGFFGSTKIRAVCLPHD